MLGSPVGLPFFVCDDGVIGFWSATALPSSPWPESGEPFLGAADWSATQQTASAAGRSAPWRAGRHEGDQPAARRGRPQRARALGRRPVPRRHRPFGDRHQAPACSCKSAAWRPPSCRWWQNTGSTIPPSSETSPARARALTVDPPTHASSADSERVDAGVPNSDVDARRVVVRAHLLDLRERVGDQDDHLLDGRGRPTER